MIRKYFAIFFLALAQIIIIGHGVVSHHHHTDIVNDGHHSGKNHEFLNSCETPCEIAFSALMHAGEYVSFAYPGQTRIVISKDNLKSLKALPVQFNAPVEFTVLYRREDFPSERYTIYLPPLHGAFTLRGPPLLIA